MFAFPLFIQFGYRLDYERDHKRETKWNLDFADDVALLSHATRQMQDKTDDLDVTSKKLGLGIHTIKSKVMRNSKAADTGVSLNGELFRICEHFLLSRKYKEGLNPNAEFG